MGDLVLSLFPGIGLLDTAFEAEGFCVVRGPDLLWGGDVRRFHPPAGRFDGVIGGPPCQSFSPLSNIATPAHGDLIPEYERCVAAAAPVWFLMENVRAAPLPAVDGYRVRALLLNNRHLGEPQNRLRRFSFGTRDGRALHVLTEALEPVDWHAAAARERRISKRAPAAKFSATRSSRLARCRACLTSFSGLSVVVQTARRSTARHSCAWSPTACRCQWDAQSRARSRRRCMTSGRIHRLCQWLIHETPRIH